MTLDCEVVLTRTGARAMRDRTTGELMHPVVGPLVEAERLYVAPSALATRLSPTVSPSGNEPLVLLDVGLGAGSNSIAAWRLSETMSDASRRLEIVSFDQSSAALELALTAEHAAAFGLSGDAGVAARALLERGRHDTRRTTWRLVPGDLLMTLPLERAASADIVFWDPFSPRAAPEHWTMTAFSALRRVCREGATVHTYSGATATRAALLLAGFTVGTSEEIGPGRRATTATAAPALPARPLDTRWLERLRRSSAPFPPDAPPDALDRIAALSQFAAGAPAV